MSLTRILHRKTSPRGRGTWSKLWAAFILDRRETATEPMAFEWLSI